MTQSIESGFIECELSSKFFFFCLPCFGARAARPRGEWGEVRVRIPHDFAVRKYPIAPLLILAVPLPKAKHAATRAKKKSHQIRQSIHPFGFRVRMQLAIYIRLMSVL